MATAAVYARVSTQDQDTESQVDQCVTFCRDHDTIDKWDIYSDVQTGHDDDRPDYLRLQEQIDDYDYFVCSEFSRISRNDDEIKRFVSLCFEYELGFNVIQNAFSVAPDADPITRQAMKMVADVLAGIATMENLQKIERIERGMKHAREAGKWDKKPPTGFEVEDGYLHVVPDEFLAVRNALVEHEKHGTSWSALSRQTGVHRTTLSNIYRDDERRELYLDGDGYDDHNRIEAALADSDMDTYLDTKAEPAPVEASDDGRDVIAMMRTLQSLQDRAREDADCLDDDELLALYNEHRSS